MKTFAASGDSARRMGERSRLLGLRKNGEVFPIEAAISNLVEEGETIFTVILRDVTLRERSDILIAKFSRWTMSSEMRSVSSALFCLAWMLPVVGRISHSPVAD